MEPRAAARCLGDAVALTPDKVLNPLVLSDWGTGPWRRSSDQEPLEDTPNRTAAGAIATRMGPDTVVLVVLAAGRGSRFGLAPKCIQPVRGQPLARHAIDAFRRLGPSLVLCLVGYEHEAVVKALGDDNVYVGSEDPAGGTAFAAFEAFCVPGLRQADPLLVITMGDRIVPTAVFRRLIEAHRSSPREADLTFLTAGYVPPGQRGKGRVVRDAAGRVLRILEQRDIDAIPDQTERQRLDGLAEGNCPLYAIRAATLFRHLASLTNDNAQQQYYLTDLVEAISRGGGDLRTVTVSAAEPEFEVLCADVTRPADLVRLDEALTRAENLGAALGQSPPHGRDVRPQPPGAPGSDVDVVVRAIVADRPKVQVAAIARQIEALLQLEAREGLQFAPDRPVAMGISGGRFRIAMMHPDMDRFFGPAWQMPIGAGHPAGEEQIVLLMQSAEDGRIHLHPREQRFRERFNSMPAGLEVMYPDESVTDPDAYELFGTRMSEAILRLLGYESDDVLEERRARGEPLPPTGEWVSASLRRPWPLVANALASLRTVRTGELGAKVQARYGRAGFRGLRILSTGSIPEGGFSSSSAVTVATLNALDALHRLAMAPEALVRLACQAEYGTGVRAGPLDQATEQTGRAGLGTLISSNPRDGYRPLGIFPVPTERIRVLFPCSVARDREAWRWSWGAYAEAPSPGRLTTGEVRKMTGKAAAIAALLTRLPLDTAFFQPLEEELLREGMLSRASRSWVASVLRQLPLRCRQAELRERFEANGDWLVTELERHERLDATRAGEKAAAMFPSLLAGWHDPILRRATAAGEIVVEEGLPLRATVAYLFSEVVKNFRLIHHPDEWITGVAASQLGDRCVDLDPRVLPSRAALEAGMPWEAGAEGPALLDMWLDRFGATPFDFNRGLDDESLSAPEPPEFHRLEGSSFFRGLALIDLAEAMLVRAFGGQAVAVRVNAAGQGDYFQVHVDQQLADVEEVKEFIRRAFYRRFGLTPATEFVNVHPGGGAVGARLDCYAALPELVRGLLAAAAMPNPPEHTQPPRT